MSKEKQNETKRKEVFIKYNPYKLETKIKIDGNNLKENSMLREKSTDGTRLQEWVEELPQILIDESNDTAFNITFHGTLPDYEDLTAVFTQAYQSGKLTATLNRKAAKETGDKEAMIDKIFEEIQKGPFEDLKTRDLKDAFKQAKSQDFKVCVVATMSAGKSTLINAMLGQKLMPSRQEACTAIITCIKDSDAKGSSFGGVALDNDDNEIETQKTLTYPIMERLNSCKEVSRIEVSGNIPFVKADDTSLVLIDTPGPNNSRNERHKEVQRGFLGSSSKALILYVITPEFGTTDDDELIRDIAKSMAVGGKQSKDRFIFVVNKIDTRRQEDGDLKVTLDRIRTYLEEHGIAKPNLFPAAALPALNIRLMENGVVLDEDSKDETKLQVKKLNRNESLHLEEYAILPLSIRNEIKDELLKEKAKWEAAGREGTENPKEALIHTGIISVEASIRQYVQKYAKTAKIKNIVDTFTHRIDSARYEENLKLTISENEEERDKISQQIHGILKKMDDMKEAQKFDKTVDEAVETSIRKAEAATKNIVTRFYALINKDTTEISGTGTEIEKVKANALVEHLESLLKKLEPQFQSKLQTVIQDNLAETARSLIDDYKKKLEALKINSSGIEGVKIDPLVLMNGRVSSVSVSIEGLAYDKEVVSGSVWKSNSDKKWYKPWTWPQKSGHYQDSYKTVQFIKIEQLIQEFLTPIEDHMFENGNNASKHASEQCRNISKQFKQEFKRLDSQFREKLNELESFTAGKDKIEKLIKKSEENLAWLNSIKAKVEDMLEI